MTEKWKDILGYEGYYQVSNLGRVKSVPITGKGIGKGSWRKSLVLKGEKEKSGKVRYTLQKDGKHRKYFAHVLVAQTFPEICGSWFEGCHVHHKDLNRSNNEATNLICLVPEQHFNLHKSMGYHSKEKNAWYGKELPSKTKIKIAKKLKKPIIQSDRSGKDLVYWFSATDCEKETGFDKAAINRCCLGKQKTSYGFYWRYAS